MSKWKAKIFDISHIGIADFASKGIGVIFPWYSLTKWCQKNLGMKFYIRNLDYFIQLNIEGGLTLLLNMIHKLKKEVT